jgi:hypothetical protein
MILTSCSILDLLINIILSFPLGDNKKILGMKGVEKKIKDFH